MAGTDLPPEERMTVLQWKARLILSTGALAVAAAAFGHVGAFPLHFGWS